MLLLDFHYKYDRELVRAESQRARAEMASRLEISKLALDQLRARHDKHHFVYLETKQQALVVLEDKYASNRGELVVIHEKEVAELETQKFALYEEFDARRDSWMQMSQADERLLIEEGEKYKQKILQLADKKKQAEEMANNALQKVIGPLEKEREVATTHLSRFAQYDQRRFGFLRTQQEADRKISEARERADLNQRVRERVHTESVEACEAAWKTLHLELSSRAGHTEPQHRQARVALEEAYHHRLTQQNDHRKTTMRRHANELKEIEREHISAVDAVVAAYDLAETELQDERRRVDDWFAYLLEESARCQSRIDVDEQQALTEITLQEEAAADVAQNLWPAMEKTTTSCAASTVEVTRNEVEMTVFDTKETENSPVTRASNGVAGLESFEESAATALLATSRVGDDLTLACPSFKHWAPALVSGRQTNQVSHADVPTQLLPAEDGWPVSVHSAPTDLDGPFIFAETKDVARISSPESLGSDFVQV